jgi:aldose 1-epimerase
MELYTLTCGPLSCEILTYGGALRSLTVPDRAGKPVDVVLGYENLEDYRRQDKYLGALVGRYANRIGDASFELDGVTYSLAPNDGGRNHLHGGTVGFDKQEWAVMDCDEKSLSLALKSPHGQEGYPGALAAQVTYTLSRDALTITYEANTDRPTLCNLTSHAYFNLSGHGSGPVTDQLIQLEADRYTPSDAGSIPTGEIVAVAGTPMDLRQLTPIGAHIDDDFLQLRQAGGYDHNWVINGQPGTLRPAARAYSPATGITLEALTTQPGLQFYTGNFLGGCPAGKGGAVYADRCGFCLEAQLFPDSPHHPNFPSAVLRPGETWWAKTVYRFSVK